MRIARPSAPSTAPEITAVIPCYNYGRYLPRAVHSILSQTGVRARVIIVDDASTDDSAEVAVQLAAGESRVRLIRHETNMGHIKTYNDGLDAVATKYVNLVSADDLVAPGAYARAVAVMEKYPRVGLVYGRTPYFTTPEPVVRSRHHHLQFWAIWRGTDWMAARVKAGANIILSPEAVMRTAAVREVGAYNAELPHSGDLEYWLRTAQAGWDIARVVGRDQAYYRVHATNMHSVSYSDEVLELEHRLAAFAFLDRHGEIRGGSRVSRTATWDGARRAVARLALESAMRQLDSGQPADVPQQLAEFAEQTWPACRGSLIHRRVMSRIRAARRGRPRTAAQTIEHWVRRQTTRVRFRVRATVGE